MTEPLLRIENLDITYGEASTVVRGVSLEIAPGEAYGLIGESGSGKTSIAFSIVNYLRDGRVTTGRILFEGRDVLHLGADEMQSLRGGKIAMVYQDPLSALNPLMKVGDQVAEAVVRSGVAGRAAVREAVLRLFEEVKLPQPDVLFRRYPHELSGGQQQRVVIAMALAAEPALLVMDEPTTGLDVTTEAVILDLIAELKARRGLSLLFISHNLAVIGRVCDRAGVLHRGELVEEGPTRRILVDPAQPYTRELLAAVPQVKRLLAAPPTVAAEPPERAGAPLLEARGLNKSYRGRGGLFGGAGAPVVTALQDVDLDIGTGETLAVVGESGSGKSTLARCIAGLAGLESGRIAFGGEPVDIRPGRRGMAHRRHIQIVFQNPESALNPLLRVGQIIARPLKLYGLAHGRAVRDRAVELMEAVELDPGLLRSFPWQLSGGQKQRVSIARAFAAEPELIICDEPTSALDLSVQARLLAQLRRLQAQRGTSYLFISHDLGVVSAIAHKVAVMHRGRIVERGGVAEVLRNPRQDYTRLLLASMSTIESALDKRSVSEAARRMPKPANVRSGARPD